MKKSEIYSLPFKEQKFLFFSFLNTGKYSLFLQGSVFGCSLGLTIFFIRILFVSDSFLFDCPIFGLAFFSMFMMYNQIKDLLFCLECFYHTEEFKDLFLVFHLKQKTYKTGVPKSVL